MAWSDMTKFAITRKRVWNYINQLIDNTDWLKDNIGGGGAGDMLKSVYDVNDNGIVDSSEYVTDGSTENTSSASEIRGAIDDIDSIMNGGSVQGSYKTGWIACSDWTNAQFNITHNLNSNLSDLIVKFFISTDGTDENAIEVKSVNTYYVSAYYNAGIQVAQNGVNSIKLQTGENGIRYLLSDGTTSALGGATSAYYKVAIYKMGDVLVSTPTLGIYDSDWILNDSGDWTNQQLGDSVGGNVFHNLDANISDLIIKVLISPDGTDANSWEVNNFARLYDATSPTARNYSYGTVIFQIDSNTFTVQTGDYGVGAFNSSGTLFVLDNESTYYYKIKVYKLGNISITPAEAFEVKNVADDYTLTSADNGVRELRVTPSTADITITLPYRSIRYGIDLKVINCGDGTYSVNVVTQGAETINGTSSVEITEANGWWKFCPGNATSTEWKTRTNGYSTIYETRITSNVTLAYNGTWQYISASALTIPAGKFRLDFNACHQAGFDSATASYVHLEGGVDNATDTGAPAIVRTFAGSFGLWSSNVGLVRGDNTIHNWELETSGMTLYAKVRVVSNGTPTSNLLVCGSIYPLSIKARRTA